MVLRQPPGRTFSFWMKRGEFASTTNSMKQDSLARTIGRRLDSVKGQRANVRREEFDSGSQVARPRLSVFGVVTLPNRVNRLHEPDIPRSAGPPERPILGLRDLGTERSFWKGWSAAGR